MSALLAGLAMLAAQQGQGGEKAEIDALLVQGRFVLQVMGQRAPDAESPEPVLSELLSQIEQAERSAARRADLIALGDQVARTLSDLAPHRRGELALTRLATDTPPDPAGAVTTRTWQWLHIATQAWIDDRTAPAERWLDTIQRHTAGAPAYVEATARERDSELDASRAEFLAAVAELVARRAEQLMGHDELATSTVVILRKLGIDLSPCARVLTQGMNPEKYGRLMRLDISPTEGRVNGLTHVRLPAGATLVRAVSQSQDGVTELPRARLLELGIPLLPGCHRLALEVAGRKEPMSVVVDVPPNHEDIVLPALEAVDGGSWLFARRGKQTEVWAIHALTGNRMVDRMSRLHDRYEKAGKALLQEARAAAAGPVLLTSSGARTLVNLCANHDTLCQLPTRELGRHLEAARRILLPLGVSLDSRLLTDGPFSSDADSEPARYLVLHARRIQ